MSQIGYSNESLGPKPQTKVFEKLHSRIKTDFCSGCKSLIDWLIFILLSQESDGALCFGRIRTRLGVDRVLIVQMCDYIEHGALLYVPISALLSTNSQSV